jgi:hypothetical protein
LGLVEVFGVGANLGVLAYFAAAGLVLGLYTQFFAAPRKRLAHMHAGQRTPEYEQELLGLYRLTPYYAVRRVLGERTDALMDVSAKHALRLLGGNIFLVAMVVLFAANSTFKIDTRWQNVIAFVVLVLILLFKPAGILGEHLPEKV